MRKKTILKRYSETRMQKKANKNAKEGDIDQVLTPLGTLEP
jgi:hypothetical protein